MSWFERLGTPAAEPGSFLPEDRVPETLDPVFRVLFAEQFDYFGRLVEAIDAYCAVHPDASRVPRSLGDTSFCMGGVSGVRKLTTFGQWMLQRPLDAYAGLGPDDREPVALWLDRVGGREAMRLVVENRFVRRKFVMALERAGRLG